jgi:diguanylate cyclase (GGDEF)-like protein/PAS domain S-box-containing protein
MSDIVQNPAAILVVEDDAGDFGLVRAHARLAGLLPGGESDTLIWVKTLAEALSVLDRRRPDVVLLDLALPDSSGIATVQAIHEAAPDVPIVVLTGNDDHAQASAALLAGAQDYLVKGRFEHHALGSAIRHALVRKRLERGLAQTQERLELALSGADLGLWDWDITSGRLALNERTCAMLGYTLAEVEPHIDAWRRWVHPDDLSAVEAAVTAHLKGQSAAYEFEYRMCHKSGRWVWMLDRGKVVERGAEGKPLRAAGTQLDISVRKAAEEELRVAAIAFESQEGIVVTDVDNVILKINHAFTASTGYAPDEAVGQRMTLLKSGVQDGSFYAAMWDCIKRTGEWHGEIWNRRKNGEIHPDWLIITAVKRDDGMVTHYVGTLTDISTRKRAEQMLQDSAARLRATLDSALDGAISIDAAGRLIDFNPAAEATFGWKKEEILGRLMADVIVPEQHRAAHAHGLARFVQTREKHIMNQRVEITALRRDGSEFPVELTITAIRQNDEDLFTAYIRDITERKQTEDELRIAATAFESQEGIFVTDARKVILRVNHAFSEITGYAAEDVIGKTPRLFSSGRHDADFYQQMQQRLDTEGAWQGEIWNRRKNGEVFPEWLTITAVKKMDGMVTHYVSTLTDITLRKAAEDEMRSLAFYDPLTELPNRRLLLDRLQQALTVSARTRHQGALLFIDLDNFKTLNDTLGHDIGDLLLQQVAERLLGCVREGDTVARLGGDEFVLMLEELSEDSTVAAAYASTVGDKILQRLGESYRLAVHDYRCTPSIGATLFGAKREDVTEVLKRADVAMYQAKAGGRNAQCFIDSDVAV